MTFKYRYRKQIVISIIGIFIVFCSITSFIVFSPKSNNKVSSSKTILLSKNESNKTEEVSTNKVKNDIDIYYKVDVKGQVNNPGIYTLKKDSRVIDAIEAAGGLNQFSNTTVINLSKKIIDEMVIIIYSNDEVNDFSKTKEIESMIIDKCIQKDDESLKNDACIGKSEEVVSNIININTADISSLMTLNGIGEAKANDIIKYREENGGFKQIEDVKNVSGIGDALFDKIKENIAV